MYFFREPHKIVFALHVMEERIIYRYAPKTIFPVSVQYRLQKPNVIEILSVFFLGFHGLGPVAYKTSEVRLKTTYPSQTFSMTLGTFGLETAIPEL